MNITANLSRLRSALSGKKERRGENDNAQTRIEELMAAQIFPHILDHALSRLPVGTRWLLGDKAGIGAWIPQPRRDTQAWQASEWNWTDAIDSQAALEAGPLVIGRIATTAGEWNALAGLKQKFGPRIFTLTELLLPFTQISILQKVLSYFFKTLDELMPYYLGQKDFAPFEGLNAVFPLAGRSVIEFGPLDGCQTAGLVKWGARVDCIEARGDNVAKTRAAANAMGWPHVRVFMDDFHNADAVKYGRYDLAFAHGVYYHSVAPFLFLENLTTLADHVFLGGFCATDENPATPWLTLQDGGAEYRVKTYDEGNSFVSGMNRVGYFLHKDDLMAFFARRGFEIAVISDKPVKKVRRGQAGVYLRFLARRKR